jgi:Flp pilus assembly protein TadG
MSRSRNRPSPSRCTAQRGGAALEFALVLPLLLGFVLAGLDLAAYVAQVQRTAAAAAAAADLASQIDRFSPQTDVKAIATGRELAVLALAASQAAQPQPLLSEGALVVTSMVNTGVGPAVAWQQRWGRPDLPGLIGAGNTGGITLAVGEGVMPVRPWLFSGGLMGLPAEFTVRRTAVRRPRLAVPVIG